MDKNKTELSYVNYKQLSPDYDMQCLLRVPFFLLIDG